ncbi:efflux RND transporter periplasmic adaptor subunit [Inmirania thermothiophila]|uniref:RND family efflux transporter MFP subunit n=1 Tax=Inmirania thermothiophila TaxID=1750597 RepID=A0A3N1Y6G7_9GAMM|nr:efflux RND transporter periplasmic adaptor subunit [Inmirania thermothiophila]ROR34416.1 RND family efflux transporter MFP subunit [Inmirania thermothiophila]
MSRPEPLPPAHEPPAQAPPRRAPGRALHALAALALLAAGAGVAAWLMATAPEAPRRPPAAAPPPVRWIEAVPRPVRATVQSHGTVAAAVQTTLAAEAAGRLVAVELEPGGFFDAGALLARIDPAGYLIARDEARAALAAARAALREEEARAEQARRDWRQLHPGEPAPPLAAREPQLARARAEVAAAEARLRRAELDLARTEVRAPYAGRVLRRLADLGRYVTPGTALAEIHAVERAEVRLPVGDADLALLAPAVGRAVRLRAGGQAWTGRIARVEPAVDPRTREHILVAEIRDPFRPRPDGTPPIPIGQFVEAEIEGRLLAAVVPLPREAVDADGRVALIEDGGRLRRQAVEVVWRDRDRLAVRGLAAGSRIALGVPPTLPDGARVRPVAAAGGGA